MEDTNPVIAQCPPSPKLDPNGGAAPDSGSAAEGLVIGVCRRELQLHD